MSVALPLWCRVFNHGYFPAGDSWSRKQCRRCRDIDLPKPWNTRPNLPSVMRYLDSIRTQTEDPVLLERIAVMRNHRHPKPIEPTRIAAVVEDANGEIWQRTESSGDAPWWSEQQRHHASYDDIDVLYVLYPGVDQEATEAL